MDLDSDGASHLFKKLHFAKNDLLQMCSRDLLRKDFKKWKMEELLVGISSVTLSVSDWKKRDLSHGKDWLSALKDFAKEVTRNILNFRAH